MAVQGEIDGNRYSDSLDLEGMFLRICTSQKVIFYKRCLFRAWLETCLLVGPAAVKVA